MTPDETPAPSFPAGGAWRSRSYPLKGAKTGPAWRAMWRALTDEDWTPGADLVAIGAEAGECTAQTARLLLIRAANAGVIERQGELSGSRTRTVYRRASVTYRQVVAELADGKFHGTGSGALLGLDSYLEELVGRGAVERRARASRFEYRLTWKPPAAIR